MFHNISAILIYDFYSESHESFQNIENWKKNMRQKNTISKYLNITFENVTELYFDNT